MRLAIFILFLVISSCCKINYIDPPEVNNPVMDSIPYHLIWETPLFDDTLGSYSVQFPPVIIGDLVIYASNDNGWGPAEERDYVKAYDLLTGEVKWVWSDYKLSRKRQGGASPQIYNNTVIVSSAKEIYGLNSVTGKEEFYRITDGYRSVVQVSKNILFYSEEYYPEGNTSSIFMYNDTKNTWRDIYKINRGNEYEYVKLYPPEVEFNENNDTILYFQERKRKKNNNFTNSNLYCYNLTKNTLLWKIDSVDALLSPFKLVL